MIGRLPWRTLGLEPLRDGNGECLWYAVSGSHQRHPASHAYELGQPQPPRHRRRRRHRCPGLRAHHCARSPSGGDIFGWATAARPEPRPRGGDDVARCGGNYDVANYLDPATATALGGVTNYLAGTNKASGLTDAVTPKALSPQGKVFDTGSAFLPNACQGSNCNLVANDIGLSLTGDALFGAIRKSCLLPHRHQCNARPHDDCLRDEIASAGGPAGYARIAGADNNACYGSGVVPLGYYPHYRDLIFVARGAMTVNGVRRGELPRRPVVLRPARTRPAAPVARQPQPRDQLLGRHQLDELHQRRHALLRAGAVRARLADANAIPGHRALRPINSELRHHQFTRACPRRPAANSPTIRPPPASSPWANRWRRPCPVRSRTSSTAAPGAPRRTPWAAACAAISPSASTMPEVATWPTLGIHLRHGRRRQQRHRRLRRRRPASGLFRQQHRIAFHRPAENRLRNRSAP